MFHSRERKEGMSAAIYGLWRNWAIAVGFLTLLAFVAPLTPQKWLAPLSLGVYFALQIVRGAMKNASVPVCSRLYKEVSVIILILTGVVLLRYFSGYGPDASELTGQPVSSDSPIIAIIISAPVTVVVTLGFLLQRKEPLVCQLCHLRYGNVVEHGFIGQLYRHEWRFQTRLLMILSFVMAVVDWTYYLTHYVNVNFNRADHFYFMWLPLVLYAVSLIYLGRRYYSMWVYYCQEDSSHLVGNPSTTTIRYVILSQDKILLDIRHTSRNFGNGAVVKRFDTPATVSLPYTERFDDARAAMLFTDITGIKGAEVRRIYDSPDNVTYRNIFHYFAFLDSTDEVIDSKMQGEWFTLGELRELMSQHLTDADINAELARIYRIAMAWKTYDREGRRLYHFKHYRPTFRLRDIRKWEVDYNDGNWLRVGRKNEDWKFYRLSRFFDKIRRVFSRTGKSVNFFLPI